MKRRALLLQRTKRALHKELMIACTAIMVGSVGNSEPSETRAEENRRALHSVPMQRFRLIGSAIGLIAMLIALSARDVAGPTVAILSVPAVVALLLCAVRTSHAFYPRIIVPVSIAIAFGCSIIAHTLLQPAPDALRYGALFLVLGALLCGIAPTRRSILTAAIAMAIVEGVGAILLEIYAVSFTSADAAVMLVIAVALPFFVSDILDDARQDAGAMRAELSRRATSDDLSGVSNRAHISLLAQNEFSRARRYGEPYSCLMIEIERFDALLADHGSAAMNAIVHVFTGYCVVVMRHCDSFGRLAPSRFLALLPETPAAGAITLSNRMCRDLAALNVAFAGGSLTFTVSIGVTEMHVVDRGGGEMLRRAEQALADAQERGGNCAVFITPPIHQRADAEASPDQPSIIPQ